MQDTEHAGEICDILNRLKTIKSCKHGREVEAWYKNHGGFRFQMCRKCWNHETYHKISEDSMQIIKPKQLGVVHAMCLGCGLDMESCGCKA